MTITTHIAEIFRQGIWGSLTGGWYYEPSHSVFVNTAHMYLWLVLMILPFIIGLVTSGIVSIPVTGAYIAFVTVLFVLIKVVVWYLHGVFDTTEPIMVQNASASEDVGKTMNNNESGELGMEMADLSTTTAVSRRPLTPLGESADEIFADEEASTFGSSAARTYLRSRLASYSGTGDRERQRRVRIDDRCIPAAGRILAVAGIPSLRARRHTSGRRASSIDLGRSESTVAIETEKVFDNGEKSGSDSSERTASHSDPDEEPEMKHVVVDVIADAQGSRTTMVRKFSEPMLTHAVNPSNNERRRSSDASLSRVRRANSSFEAADRRREEGMLSLTSLQQARQSTHKSVPSKMSGEEAFKTGNLSRNRANERPDESEMDGTMTGYNLPVNLRDVALEYSDQYDNNETSSVSESACQPSTSETTTVEEHNVAGSERMSEPPSSRTFGMYKIPEEARLDPSVAVQEKQEHRERQIARACEKKRSSWPKGPSDDVARLTESGPDLDRNAGWNVSRGSGDTGKRRAGLKVAKSATFHNTATEHFNPVRDVNEPGECEDEPCCSSSAWNQVVVDVASSRETGDVRGRGDGAGRELQPVRRLSRGSLARIDEAGVLADGSSEAMKRQITMFLEDLIYKFPETLDAIESVRQSRLGRPQRDIRRPSTTPGSTTTVTALSDLAHKEGTHIASGHEDTTQGAVHSFQDDQGVWWTYAFDHNGVGTAQPLGSGGDLQEMIRQRQNERKAKLDVVDESEFASSEEEAGEGGERPSTSTTAAGPVGPVQVEPIVRERSNSNSASRRERAMSSSSNESCTYIPQMPSTVFHPHSSSMAYRSGSQMNVVNSIANRLRLMRGGTGSTEHPATTRSDDVYQIMELLEGSQRGSAAGRPRGDSVPPTGLQERFLLRLDSGSSSGRPSASTRLRFLTELGTLPNINLGGNQPPQVLATDFVPRRQSVVKRKYYYRLKMFSKSSKGFLLKMDRLAISSLFDRNRSILSCVFDVLLAVVVAATAAAVLSSGIFYDLHLVLFALVVAGSHFSLLKSVQPDAASPIHGFNWLVAYSRPIYFCLFCGVLLLLHYLSGDYDFSKMAWNGNIYRLDAMSSDMIIIALRDLVSWLVLLLPVAFTLGLLPQVNTLFHHVLEQLEMHLMGGSASFGAISAAVQLLKSLGAWAVLAALCDTAYKQNSVSTQTPMFSAFLAVAVSISYIMSRMSSNPQLHIATLRHAWDSLWTWPSSGGGHRLLCTARPQSAQDVNDSEGTADEGCSNPVPKGLVKTQSLRIRHDALFAILLALVVFALHSTSLFTATQPYFVRFVVPITCVVGLLNHYLYQQLRTHTPWKLLAHPLLRSVEYNQFESTAPAELMVFEVIHVWLQAIERNILMPLTVLSVVCSAAWKLPYPTITTALLTQRLLRGGYAHPQLMYVPCGFAYLATSCDWHHQLPFGIGQKVPTTAMFMMVFYLCVILYPKWLELYHKVWFVMSYVAPWQISWGSAFHAFAQPFAVPHSALVVLQTFFSSLISAPLNPFLGSSFFMTSYVRPVKFWERDYNTKRSDASNTRLASQIDRGPMMDDGNLNAVFYEHLTRSLQDSLAGDLMMGRWATSVEPGDCFILASFYLNCLVHVIEVGNGFVTFQLRGLEFRGTYCHQREVEAISEEVTDGTGCCCCSPGSLPGFLSLNSAWGLRWLAWEVVSGKYLVDGYSITDNSAVNLLQVHELRRLLVTLYVKCICYYLTTSPKYFVWLKNADIRSAMEAVEGARYVDVDHMFSPTNDDDYDVKENGISRASFKVSYGEWVAYCGQQRMESAQNEHEPDSDIREESVESMCFLLSVLGRRVLAAASFNRHSTAAESFLYGLHALFKGDFRITCQRDEWVFADMDLLRCVLAPAVKMALKLHQDHFAATTDFDKNDALYDVISNYQRDLFISHEHDPLWRKAILDKVPSLLALRHMYDDGQDDYKIVMLNKMQINMRVIKLNRECVRAFWSGQQQELIFLRNRNPERGSIQNARQVLRNMINSSADQPVGYPIYVSPLTTSFVESHAQTHRITGPTVTLDMIGGLFASAWSLLRSHFGTSNSLSQPCVPREVRADTDTSRAPPPHPPTQAESVVFVSSDGGAHVSIVKRLGERGEVPSTSAKRVMDTSDSASTASKRDSEAPSVGGESSGTGDEREGGEELADVLGTQGDWMLIEDAESVFKCLNEPLKSTGEPLVYWPYEEIRTISGRNGWICSPQNGYAGRVVHTWYPNHRDRKLRSHIGDHIYLLFVPAMANAIVPVAGRGVRQLTEQELKDLTVSTKDAHDSLLEFVMDRG